MSRHSALNVDCPACHASAGQMCREATGRYKAKRICQERKDRAASRASVEDIQTPGPPDPDARVRKIVREDRDAGW